jgi:hypothetical protein
MKEITNRSAVFIRSKEPFNEWAEACKCNDSSLEDLKEILNKKHVYLIDWTFNEDVTEVMEQYYKTIFEYELSDWNFYKHEWPENRTYEKFIEWFEVTLCDDLFDLEKGIIITEKL